MSIKNPLEHVQRLRCEDKPGHDDADLSRVTRR